MNYQAVRHYFTTRNARDGSILEIVDNYERSPSQRERRGHAITDGFIAWGHDDFNIAVWEKGQLVSWDWMDEPVDSEPSVLLDIQDALGRIARGDTE